MMAKILFVVLIALLTAEVSNAVSSPPVLRKPYRYFTYTTLALTSDLRVNPTWPLIQPQLLRLNATSFAVVELLDYDIYQVTIFTANWTRTQVFTYAIPMGNTYMRGPRTFVATTAPNNSIMLLTASFSNGYYTLVIDGQGQPVVNKFINFIPGSGAPFYQIGCRINNNMTVLSQGGGMIDLVFIDNTPSLISYNRYLDSNYINTACDGTNLYAAQQSQQTGLLTLMKFQPSNWTIPSVTRNTTKFSTTKNIASITIVGNTVVVVVTEGGIMRIWQVTTGTLTEVLYKELSDVDTTIRYPSFTSDGYFAFSQRIRPNGTWVESQMELSSGTLVPKGLVGVWTSQRPFDRPNWSIANYPDLYGNGYISIANDMDMWMNRSWVSLDFHGDVCGDGVVSGTAEQCDSGQFCTAKCQCEPGYIPTYPRGVGCVLDTSFTNCTMCSNDTQCSEQQGACVGYRVAPIFQCFEERAFGTKRAFFSYRSNNTATIHGGTSNNKMKPYGLPIQDFELGRPFFYPYYAFYVDYTAHVTTVEWYLDGISVTFDISNSSLLCPQTLSLIIEADTPSLTQMIAFVDKLRTVLAQAMNINTNFISITTPQSKKRQSTMPFRADITYDTVNGRKASDAIQTLFNNNVSKVFEQMPTVRSLDIMSVPSELGEGVIAPDVQNSPIAWSPGAIVLPDPPIMTPPSEPPADFSVPAQPVPEPVSPQEPISSPDPASGVKPDEGNPTANGSRWSNSYIAIIVLVPAAVAVAIFLAVYFSRKKKRHMNNDKLNRTQFNMPLTELRGEESNYGTVPDLSQPGTRESGKYGPITHIDAANLTGDRLHVRYSELKFKEEIGAGAYGKVFIGEWQRIKVALKINTSATGDDFAREARLMVDLRPHPNVVQMLGVSSDGPYPVMILEFCDGGSLDDIVFNTEEPITVQQQLEMVLGIAKGLYHLHVNQIVHRDLAARNILMSHNTPKISDFGLSRQVGEQQKGTTKSTVGPIRWMAPESLKSMTYSTKSDVWSFGVVVSEVVSGQEPHTNEDQMAIGLRIRDQGFTPSIPFNSDPVLKQIMQQCWQRDPEARPTMEQICDILDQYMDERKEKN